MVMALAVYHTSADDDRKGIVSGICGRCNLLVNTPNTKIVRAVMAERKKRARAAAAPALLQAIEGWLEGSCSDRLGASL